MTTQTIRMQRGLILLNVGSLVDAAASAIERSDYSGARKALESARDRLARYEKEISEQPEAREYNELFTTFRGSFRELEGKINSGVKS